MLAEKIDSDLKTAMKEKNEIKLSTLRMLKSAAKYKAIEKKTETLSDEDFVDVIQKQVKQRKDSIAEFEKAGRKDLVAKEAGEMKILEEYLPAQMSYEEVKAIVKTAISAVGATSKQDMGKVMKEVMPKVKGKADGQAVSKAVAELLP